MVRTTNPDIDYLVEHLGDEQFVLISIVRFPEEVFSSNDVIYFRPAYGSDLADAIYEATREHATALDSGEAVLFCERANVDGTGRRKAILPPSMKHHAEVVQVWLELLSEEFSIRFNVPPHNDA